MGLRDLTLKAYDTAFAVAGDLVKPVTYHSATVSTYNETTGVVTPPAAGPQVNAMFFAIEKSEVPIKAGDQRVMIRDVDLLTVVPSTQDWIDDAGTRLEILNVRRDAMRASFSFHCRAVPS